MSEKALLLSYQGYLVSEMAKFSSIIGQMIGHMLICHGRSFHESDWAASGRRTSSSVNSTLTVSLAKWK
jgi:hypothetical protein